MRCCEGACRFRCGRVAGDRRRRPGLWAWLLLGVSGLAGYSPAPAEAVVLSQPPRPDDGGAQSSAQPYPLSGGWTHVYKTADDFTLPAPAWVQRVKWWGHSYDGRHGDNDVISQVSRFRLEFFSAGADGTIPGASVYAEEIAVERTSPSATALQSITGCQVYEHTADLSQAVALSGGRTYWLSVSAYLDEPPMWTWLAGAGNRNHTIDVNVDGTWGDHDFPPEYLRKDMAFELALPEPAGAAWLALGGVGLLRRRGAQPRPPL